MVASHAAMQDTPQAVVLEMAEHMETLADAGDWTEVESLAVRLRAAVMRVPETDRAPILMAVQKSTERVSEKARAAREDVTGRISAIRRGQAATKAYDMR